MNASFISKSLLSALMVLGNLQDVDSRRPHKFDGKSIPDPPRQRATWTPPQTKLPKFLISSTAALFEQGIADPRECEYREVEVGDWNIIKTHGFVLPQRAGEANRFVITWDGVVFPASSVGAAADLDEDVRALTQSMKPDGDRAAPKNPNREDHEGGFTDVSRRGGMWSGGGPAGPDSRSALKLCLLLRLGRADLAERLFAAGTTWTPDAHGPDLTDYHISYLTLATDWAAAVFVRLVSAHMRGDDVIALDAARRLASFAKAVDTTAEAMGFQRIHNRFTKEPPAYLPFLRQLPELVADQEQRAKEPARGPIPPRGGNPSARISALIRHLDEINEPQRSHFGGPDTGQAPIARALAAEGEPALEPLLAALETDTRLTRSVTYGRGNSIDRTVHPVFEAEFSAVLSILQTNDFGHASYGANQNDPSARKALVRSLRSFWEKNRDVSMNERCYRTLRDETAGYSRWLDAARRIVQSGNMTFMFATRPRTTPPPPMLGEELRSRRDPSVTELLVRRISNMLGSSNSGPRPYSELGRACELACILARGDSTAARPLLQSIMSKCRDMIEVKRKGESNTSPWPERDLAELTIMRAEIGDRGALDEYAAWIRTTVPKELENQSVYCWEPLWTYPDHPKIAEAARWLFNDPESPYILLIRSPGGRTDRFFGGSSLPKSPLMTVAGYRETLISTMAITSAMGTVRRGGPGMIDYQTNDGVSGGSSCSRPDLDLVKPDVALPFRTCDYIAWQIASLEGAPEFALYWPEDRRDRAVAASIAYLKKYGDRFTVDPPAGTYDAHRKESRLVFPKRSRAATAEDVRANRAIFSLEGQGEVRLSKVPEFPIPARWVTLKDFPIDVRDSEGNVYHQYEQEGQIWQAEEVREGNHWERYFGFVGSHVIARVPAAQIEFGDGRFDQELGILPIGLDAMIEPVESRKTRFEPGQPIPVTLKFRNRRGVENRAPTEFLRQEPGGRPSWRRGVAVAINYSPPALTRSYLFSSFQEPGEALRPKHTDHFEPGKTTRVLGPFETFEAMRLELNDSFDMKRPGSYRVQITFAADSGLGIGKTEWDFTVGDREDAVP